MKVIKKQLIFLVIIVLVSVFMITYKLPYYIYKPGGADALDPIVEVDSGYNSEGDMHLVTIRGGQATPIQYLSAKLLPHQEVRPLDEVFPEGISEDQYFNAQLQVMETSQESATVVAYEAADQDITIDFDGVYVVAVVEEMPADGILQAGDQLVKIDDKEIKEANDLIDFIANKEQGDQVEIKISRDDEDLIEEITLEELEQAESRIGIGVSLVTDRHVTVEPDVNFASGNIGGPSAGLMFSLEIYDQLTEKDLTKGYQIAGTGEVDYDGNVLRIGGVDKKVIAADREGCDIFFAPSEGGSYDSNYLEAQETADEIKTDMKIVAVDTFEEALDYLENLE